MAKRVIKKNMKRKQGRKSLYGIKQGVGQVTKRAFPTKSKKPKKTNRSHGRFRFALNAMHPHHLPLPRAVGGYTVIRTTDILNTNRIAMLFGTMKGPGSQFTDTCWSNIFAVGNRNDAGMSLPIGDGTLPGNVTMFSSQALSASAIDSTKMVPAAITLQIMNGESMQNADGIAYIGRAKTVLDLMGDTRTWETVMEQLVSYSAPRLCSGGKLALRGVQVNAIPNNLSVLSDFVPRRVDGSGNYIWNVTGPENTIQLDFEGFGPLFVYNPDKISLKYLVTIEWRMRFDPLNPAYAGHVCHTPASEATWAKVIAEAESLGNGVRDIADVVADVGLGAAMLA